MKIHFMFRSREVRQKGKRKFGAKQKHHPEIIDFQFQSRRKIVCPSATSILNSMFLGSLLPRIVFTQKSVFA